MCLCSRQSASGATRVKPQLCPNKTSVIVKSELCIRTIVDGRDCFRGALYFHSDLHLDLLASGALHLLGGKAALNDEYADPVVSIIAV